MQRTCLMVILSLVLVLAACGTTEKTSTVDDAVSLLQDVENNSLWTALEDSLDALHEQEGYRAYLTIETDDSAVRLDIQTDAAGAMRFDVQRGATTQHYTLSTVPDSDIPRRVVRLVDGQAHCEASGPDALLLENGVTSALEEAAAALSSEHLLAVIDTPDEMEDSRFLGREATWYDVEARFDEALTLASEVSSSDSQAFQAEDVTMNGFLILDRDTAALLQFSSRVNRAGKLVHVEFAVTEWGSTPITTVEVPDSLPPCP